jgi:hypothetical protein
VVAGLSIGLAARKVGHEGQVISRPPRTGQAFWAFRWRRPGVRALGGCRSARQPPGSVPPDPTAACQRPVSAPSLLKRLKLSCIVCSHCRYLVGFEWFGDKRTWCSAPASFH